MPKPRIMFYHDGRHPLIYMYEPPMQKEEYEAGVDELVGTPIEAIMFCMGDGRTVLHDTKVGELWGTPNDKWGHIIFRRAHQNAKALIDEGNDPLRIISERAHAKGLLIYPVLLVQQGSGERGLDTRTSNFRLENKHLEIGARGDLDSDATWTQFLDFKHQEVRDERFALIEETLNNYEIDGFELQLNYGQAYFHPKELKAGRTIMTQWVRQVYEAVKKSGADRELVLRVPTSIEAALAIGLDLREWVDQGIVDVLVGEEIEKSGVSDPSADFRELVAAAKGSECRVHAAVYSHLDSDRLNEATIETIRASACNYWDQDVDGLYLAQWFSQWPYQAPFYEKLRELPHPDVMAPKDKIYHVPTETGRSMQTQEGPMAYLAAQRARLSNPLMSAGPEPIQRLPVGLEVGKPATVQFTISDNLPRWDRVGRVYEVLLRVRVTESTEMDRFRFKLNGEELPDTLLRKINRMYLMDSPRYRVFGYWYVFRIDRDLWPIKGANSLEVTLLERDPDVTPQLAVRDVELDIKYLMGKNYHRGFVDADLGPYDCAVE